MFAEYCSTPFDIEAVKVINADGSDFISPDNAVTDPLIAEDSAAFAAENNITPGCL